MAQDKTFAEIAEVTCIDETAALREARSQLEERLEKRCLCVHADALHYAERPTIVSQYDIIYGVSVFEHLKMDAASRLAGTVIPSLLPAGSCS